MILGLQEHPPPPILDMKTPIYEKTERILLVQYQGDLKVNFLEYIGVIYIYRDYSTRLRVTYSTTRGWT